MDVAFCRTTPRTQVISYTKKSPPRPNQLWRKEQYDTNTFWLVSKLHPSCKIKIKVINCLSHLLLIRYLHGFTYFYRVVMLTLIALVHFFGKREMESSLRWLTLQLTMPLMWEGPVLLLTLPSLLSSRVATATRSGSTLYQSLLWVLITIMSWIVIFLHQISPMQTQS